MSISRRNMVFKVALFVLMIAVLSGCKPAEKPAETPAAEKPAEKKQMTIGTGSAGGAFFPIGTGISEIINKSVDSVKLTAEATGGAVENPRLVGAGDVDLGITNADVAYYAFNGLNQFDGNKQNIVAMGNLHDSTFQVITLPGSGINKFEDLKGKSVAIGPAGSGSAHAIEVLLKAHGMKLEDIVASNLGQSEGVEALKDGRVQAVAVLAGRPTASLLELRTSGKFNVVKVEREILDKISSEQPYYVVVTVPKSVYDLDEDYDTLAVMNVIVVSPSLDENLVYSMTKALYDNISELGTYHNAAKEIKIETAAKVPIDLHPGAAKYFREKGLLDN